MKYICIHGPIYKKYLLNTVTAVRARRYHASYQNWCLNNFCHIGRDPDILLFRNVYRLNLSDKCNKIWIMLRNIENLLVNLYIYSLQQLHNIVLLFKKKILYVTFDPNSWVNIDGKILKVETNMHIAEICLKLIWHMYIFIPQKSPFFHLGHQWGFWFKNPKKWHLKFHCSL